MAGSRDWFANEHEKAEHEQFIQELTATWNRIDVATRRPQDLSVHRVTGEIDPHAPGMPERIPLLMVKQEGGPGSYDAPGKQKWDLMVDTRQLRPDAHISNAHLVNRYIERTDVTQHHQIYLDDEIEALREAVGESYNGPGGIYEVYSVNASVTKGPDGCLKLDTSQPMEPGLKVDRHTLTEVRDHMHETKQAQARAEAQRQQQRHERTSEKSPERVREQPEKTQEAQVHVQREQESMGPVRRQSEKTPPESQATSKASSQAGVATLKAGAQVSQSPAPGQPGSRFNPHVKERKTRVKDLPNSELSQSQARRRSSSEALKGSVQGAKVGAKVGSLIPGVGNVAGGVIGAGVTAGYQGGKVSREAGDVSSAFTHGQATGGLVGGVASAYVARENKRKREIAEEQPRTKDNKGQPRTKDNAKPHPLMHKVRKTAESPQFRESVKRVGVEASKEATNRAQRSASRGGSTKAVIGEAAKGAAHGAIRGIQHEMKRKDETKRVEKKSLPTRDAKTSQARTKDTEAPKVETTKASPAQETPHVQQPDVIEGEVVDTKPRKSERVPMSQRHAYTFTELKPDAQQHRDHDGADGPEMT